MSSKYLKVFIKNTKDLLEKTGWSQAELARKLNWSPQTLNNYFLGEREPGPDKIAEIAAIFGLQPADLLRTDECPKPRIERVGLADEVRRAIHEELQSILTTEDLREKTYGIVDRAIERADREREKSGSRPKVAKKLEPVEPHAVPTPPTLIEEIISMLPRISPGRLESLRNVVQGLVGNQKQDQDKKEEMG